MQYKYPSAVLKKEIKDSDNDGMPDDWEIARGLNPNNPKDANGDYLGKGYNNIEYYINDLTVDSFPAGVVTLSPTKGENTNPTKPSEELTTEAPVKYISAFNTIEAENYDEMNGIKTEEITGGGTSVAYIENGDSITFKNVDFEDGAKSFRANVAGNSAQIDLILDNAPNAADTVKLPATGGFQTWKDVHVNIAPIAGKHDLTLKFIGGTGFLFNINNFVFSKETAPIEPLNGKLIKNLEVFDLENAAKWIISDDFNAGSKIFGDRDFTAISVPNELIGAESINTACDSKNSTKDLAAFTADDNISLYLAFDSRVTTKPAWVNSYQKTNLTFTSSNDITFEIYKKDFVKDEKITLGQNGQSAYCVNYFVLAKKSVPENILGDANGDKVFDESDIKLIQKWLIFDYKLQYDEKTPLYDNWKNADLDNNGKLNAVDLTLMKIKLKK